MNILNENDDSTTEYKRSLFQLISCYVGRQNTSDSHITYYIKKIKCTILFIFRQILHGGNLVMDLLGCVIHGSNI